MNAAAWATLAGLALLASALFVAGAFTRFDDGAPPQDAAGMARYEKAQYDAAREASLLGIAGAASLLGCAACAQRAWRTRAGS